MRKSSTRPRCKLAPASADVSNNYAVFLCRSGKVDEAIKLFDSAAQDKLYSTPWAAYTNAAVCLRANKRGAEAVSYLERALQLRPNYAEAVLELGDLQLELGHPDLAQNAVDRYLSMGAASPEVLLIGVRAAIVRGNRACGRQLCAPPAPRIPQRQRHPRVAAAVARPGNKPGPSGTSGRSQVTQPAELAAVRGMNDVLPGQVGRLAAARTRHARVVRCLWIRRDARAGGRAHQPVQARHR